MFPLSGSVFPGKGAVTHQNVQPRVIQLFVSDTAVVASSALIYTERFVKHSAAVTDALTRAEARVTKQKKLGFSMQ